MKVLEVNSVANSGSTGRIAEQIGQLAIKHGYDCYMAFGRENNGSKLKTIRIGSEADIILHGVESRLFDNHGFASRAATRRFVKQLKEINPDIIHLHNIHGYYLNVRYLFDYLKESQVPVVWTLHDCWPFTGHCAFFDTVSCDKWERECCNCPKMKSYPSSWFIDNSQNNYINKKQIFTSLTNLEIVTPSQWLKKLVEQSFLQKYHSRVIPNGVDLNKFKPVNSMNEIKKKYNIPQGRIILGVANIWDSRKGLGDFIYLSKQIQKKEYSVILVGLNDKQIKALPENIIGIKRTESTQELAALYSIADVFVNPTYSDNFPTTNIEALACGTPVITYDTGGSPEAVDSLTGRVVEKGNMDMLVSSIKEILSIDRETLRKNCRSRAERLYDKNDRFMDYIKLYDSILENNKQ